MLLIQVMLRNQLRKGQLLVSKVSISEHSWSTQTLLPNSFLLGFPSFWAPLCNNSSSDQCRNNRQLTHSCYFWLLRISHEDRSWSSQLDHKHTAAIRRKQSQLRGSQCCSHASVLDSPSNCSFSTMVVKTFETGLIWSQTLDWTGIPNSTTGCHTWFTGRSHWAHKPECSSTAIHQLWHIVILFLTTAIQLLT